MSAVACCPRCFRQVSLPESDDHSVWVRCPLCGDQYSLQTAIDFVPPALQIVPTPAMAAADEFAGHETAAAAAAFESESIFAPSGDHADVAATKDHEHARVATQEPAIDDEFDAALNLTDRATTADEDEPFVAEQEHAMDEAEHDQDEDFRFADEHHAGEGAFGESGEHAHDTVAEDHPLGEIATMAAKPPKKKRHVPLTVRLIGYLMFGASGVLGLVVVYAASLYFGFSDPFKFGPHLPDWLVAKSLRGETDRNMTKPAPNPNSLRHAAVEPGAETPKQPGSNDADSNAEPKNPPAGDDKSAAKPAIADNGSSTPPDSDSKAVSKPAPTDVAAETPAKADPAASPFDRPAKPNDPESSKDDAAKLDPPSGAPKLPSLDMPDLKIGGKPSSDKQPDKSSSTQPVADATPASRTAEKPPETTVEKPVENAAQKPAEELLENDRVKPADTIAPKADKEYSLADLMTATEAARKSSAALAEASKATDDDALIAARRVNFKAMSHLATVLTFARPGEARSSARSQQLRSQVAGFLSSSDGALSAAERDAVGDLAGKWIGYSKRTEPGIFAAGTLKSVAHSGLAFESQVALTGEKTITVFGPKPVAKEGQLVVLLGAIVDDPATNLPEYKGLADPVIFAEFLISPESTR